MFSNSSRSRRADSWVVRRRRSARPSRTNASFTKLPATCHERKRDGSSGSKIGTLGLVPGSTSRDGVTDALSISIWIRRAAARTGLTTVGPTAAYIRNFQPESTHAALHSDVDVYT